MMMSQPSEPIVPLAYLTLLSPKKKKKKLTTITIIILIIKRHFDIELSNCQNSFSRKKNPLGPSCLRPFATKTPKRYPTRLVVSHDHLQFFGSTTNGSCWCLSWRISVALNRSHSFSFFIFLNFRLFLLGLLNIRPIPRPLFSLSPSSLPPIDPNLLSPSSIESAMSDDEADPELLALLRKSLGLGGGAANPHTAETKVLENSQYVFDNAIDVALSPVHVKDAADKIWRNMQKKRYSTQSWADHELHPQSKDESTVDFIFTMDLLNFSFWSELPDDKRFAIEYRGKRWTGYWSLVAALQRALDDGMFLIRSPFWL